MSGYDIERAKTLKKSVERYFEACNSADRVAFYELLAPDCVHYFPPGTGGPFLGSRAIADLWIGFVRDKGSCWTIDRMVCDGVDLAIEWTHWKPLDGEFIRGSEWYTFDPEGKITAIWAHYASPRDPARSRNELEGFDYRGRGYRLEPPELPDYIALARRDNLIKEGDSGK